MIVQAESAATIRALVGGVAVAGSGGVGAAAGAVGMSVAENRIGSASSLNEVAAYVDGGSMIASAGDLQIKAKAADVVDTVSFAGSVAIAVGTGVTVAGAGASATSSFDTHVDAYIDESDVVAAGDVTIDAITDSQITQAKAIGVAVSAAFGGGSIAVAESSVSNTMANDVSARITSTTERSIVAGGDIRVSADAENADMSGVEVVTASISAGVVGVSGGGLTVFQEVDNQISAYVSGPSAGGTNASQLTLTAMGDVEVLASEDADIAADSSIVSVSFSLGLASGDATVTNRLVSDITAYVDQAEITSDNTTIHADSKARIGETGTVAVTAALVAAGTNSALAVIDTRVQAYAEDALLNSSEAVQIRATTDNYARASGFGGAFGGLGVGAMSASVQIGTDDADVVEVDAALRDGSKSTHDRC